VPGSAQAAVQSRVKRRPSGPVSWLGGASGGCAGADRQWRGWL